MPDYPPLTPDDVMPFGRHQGRAVWEIIDQEPSYIEWLLENTDVLFDDEAYAIYTKTYQP